MRFLPLILSWGLLLLCTSLSAQTVVGLRVLSGTSSLASPADALPTDIGWHEQVGGTTFGLVVERRITNSLSLRSGLQQTQRGATLRNGTVPSLLGAFVPYDFAAKVRMNYLEVPLALSFDFPLVRNQVVLYGWGGATAGYALTGSVKARSAKDPTSPLATTKLEMNSYLFSRFHLGYTGGLGIGFNLGETLQFRLEAEYNRSTQERSMLSPESGKHGYELLHFGAGMAFRL